MVPSLSLSTLSRFTALWGLVTDTGVAAAPLPWSGHTSPGLGPRFHGGRDSTLRAREPLRSLTQWVDPGVPHTWGSGSGLAWGWRCVWTGWCGWPAAEPRSGSHLGRSARPAWTSFQQQPQEGLGQASAPQPRPPSLLTRSCFSSQELIQRCMQLPCKGAIDCVHDGRLGSLAKVFLDFKER